MSTAHNVNPPRRDYFTILGITWTASEDEIKSAFRRKARQYHPDMNQSPEAQERFQEVMEAYRVLSDKELRHAYILQYYSTPIERTASHEQARSKRIWDAKYKRRPDLLILFSVLTVFCFGLMIDSALDAGNQIVLAYEAESAFCQVRSWSPDLDGTGYRMEYYAAVPWSTEFYVGSREFRRYDNNYPAGKEFTCYYNENRQLTQFERLDNFHLNMSILFTLLGLGGFIFFFRRVNKYL